MQFSRLLCNQTLVPEYFQGSTYAGFRHQQRDENHRQHFWPSGISGYRQSVVRQHRDKSHGAGEF
jgi:hypothetical protein